MNPQVNPLLAKVKMPGRIFPLPSRGHLYTNGEIGPECQNGEVHVRPLSAMAEIKMKSPDMLFSGKAIEEAILECVPEIKKPFELYGKDIDALLVYMRLVTYGSKFTIETKHTCEDATHHTYDIDLERIASSITFLDPTLVDANYSLVLENGQEVKLEPIKFKHIIEMVQNGQKDPQNVSELQSSLVKNISNMIKSVDDITDKTMIMEWLRTIPTSYINRITDTMARASSWGPRLEADLMCIDCRSPFLVEVPVNPVTFFSE